jgi:hypothetical protein
LRQPAAAAAAVASAAAVGTAVLLVIGAHRLGQKRARRRSHWVLLLALLEQPYAAVSHWGA